MKVDDLTGVELDYWVADAEGLKPVWRPCKTDFILIAEDPTGKYDNLKLDWNFIGHIIQRDFIAFMLNGDHWVAQSALDPPSVEPYGYSHDGDNGSGALGAIKRCIIKRKRGEEVPQ